MGHYKTWMNQTMDKHRDLSQVYDDEEIDIDEAIRVYKRYDLADPPPDWPRWLFTKIKCAYTERHFTEYKKFKAHVLKNRPK